MKKINVGDGMNKSSWSLGGDTYKTFDKHVSKSVPMYSVGHELILEVSDFFLVNNSIVYDIGCSTGSLLELLADHHKEKNVTFNGIDVEENMARSAKQRCGKYKNINIECSSALDVDFNKSNLIISYYTIQFMHPSSRQYLFDKIYNSLEWGGGFIFFEKVRAPDARFQDIMTQVYNEFKVKQGYSAEEIMGKSKSLKGVMEPFSTQGNIDLAKRAGFSDIMSIFKNICFEGFLAIK